MLHSDSVIVNESRALAGLTVSDSRNGGGFVLVFRDGLEASNGTDRQCWVWKVLDHEAQTIASGNDLSSPYYQGENESTRKYECIKSLITLLGFLDAWNEADEDSENWNLFEGQPLRDWVETNSEDLFQLRRELAYSIGESED